MNKTKKYKKYINIKKSCHIYPKESRNGMLVYLIKYNLENKNPSHHSSHHNELHHLIKLQMIRH